MVKGKNLIGRSVVGQNDGAKLGVVRDLIFDHETDELLALVLADKDLFGLIDAVVVQWSNVVNVGGDVIFARGAQSRINLKDDPRLRGLVNRETVVSGTQIVTTEGKHLGTLADVCVDEHTGRVLGYEISGGFISDTLKGKKFLPAPPNLEVGKDAAIAPAGAETQIKG